MTNKNDIIDQANYDRDELTKVAMNIIIHAGEADKQMHELLDDLAQGKDDCLKEKLCIAKEEIRLAHVAQTEVLKNEAEGKVYIPSILFIHAQDTLMTVNSALGIAEKMVNIILNRK